MASKLESLKASYIHKNVSFSKEELAKFQASQELAMKAAREVAALIQPGWSEKRAADLLNSYLRDCGVKSFFHEAFVWFGTRSRFAGISPEGALRYQGFMPTDRVCQEGDVILLDVAPIFQGYPSDIGVNFIVGENSKNSEEFNKGKDFLNMLRSEIPKMFEIYGIKGGEIYQRVNTLIKDAGFDNLHKTYPLGVLGHRLYPIPFEGIGSRLKIWQFGIHAYWSLLSRGLLPDTLRENHKGSLDGLWAIEPHIGSENFGMKFEEMLLVEKGKARWLSEKGFYHE